MFLELDHVDNDGAEHRKTVHPDGMYWWLRRNNWPASIQLLCSNCNHGKRLNGGFCPHLYLPVA